MKICLLGKFPPIQGGVSTTNLWITCALIEAGHEVHVVTNSHEVEPEFRLHDIDPSCGLPGAPAALSSPKFSFHTTSGRKLVKYIPWSNPYVTKLAAVTSDVVRRVHCDFIFASYLEPYVVSAAIASQWTRVPFGIRNAGSDVSYLLAHPELRTAYLEAYRSAAFVFASLATFRALVHEGVDPARFVFSSARRLPTDYFRPGAKPMPIDRVLPGLISQVPDELALSTYQRLGSKHFDPTLPTIGIYGKVGETKGSFDLVRALGRLRREGLRFQFLALTQGRHRSMDAWIRTLADEQLESCTWLLPFIPHWNIPNFLKTCTAVCFLEREFSVAIHNPSIPHEVTSTGTCLILSHETRNKDSNPARYRHQENVLLADPKDEVSLVASLRLVIDDPARATEIGKRGYEELSRDEDWGAFRQATATTFEEIEETITREKTAVSIAELQACLARLYHDRSSRRVFQSDPDSVLDDYALTNDERDQLKNIDQALIDVFARGLLAKQRDVMKRNFPLLFSVVPEPAMKRYFERYNALYPQRPGEPGLARTWNFTCFMAETLPGDPALPSFAADVARYEGCLYRTFWTPGPQDRIENVNRKLEGTLPDTVFQPTTRFHLADGVWVEDFEHDILTIVKQLRHGDVMAHVDRAPCTIVFQRVRNALQPKIFRINAATREVLMAGDGQTSISALSHRLEPVPRDAVLGVLDELSARRIIDVAPVATS